MWNRPNFAKIVIPTQAANGGSGGGGGIPTSAASMVLDTLNGVETLTVPDNYQICVARRFTLNDSSTLLLTGTGTLNVL